MFISAEAASLSSNGVVLRISTSLVPFNAQNGLVVVIFVFSAEAKLAERVEPNVPERLLLKVEVRFVRLEEFRFDRLLLRLLVSIFGLGNAILSNTPASCDTSCAFNRSPSANVNLEPLPLVLFLPVFLPLLVDLGVTSGAPSKEPALDLRRALALEVTGTPSSVVSGSPALVARAL